MDAGFPELFRAALRSVELCEVGSDERVVIYTDSQAEPVLSEAWYSACVARGCDPTLIRAMTRVPEADPPPSAVAAMIEADLVFDIPSSLWEYAPSGRQILESGTRMLEIELSARSVVERAFSMEFAWRADVAEGLLRNAREIRVTSPEGTDLRATLSEERPLDVARGYVREPGAWDVYGTSCIAAAPIEESVDGHIYFNGPLFLEPLDRFAVEKPVHVEVERGRIVQIDTSHKDAQILKRWFEQFDDPNAYSFSHIGWGWDPNVQLPSGEIMEEMESLYGAVTVAFGSNAAPHLGGVVESAAHMDGSILTPSLWLDGHQIIKDGEFTDESGLRERG